MITEAAVPGWNHLVREDEITIRASANADLGRKENLPAGGFQNSGWETERGNGFLGGLRWFPFDWLPDYPQAEPQKGVKGNQKENAQLAKDVLDNTRNNYVQGLASLTDLLDAENALTEAQNNYTSAILEYKLAEIQLIKSKGELKTLINN